MSRPSWNGSLADSHGGGGGVPLFLSWADDLSSGSTLCSVAEFLFWWALLVLEKVQGLRRFSCVCLFLQKPSRPLPVHTTSTRCVLGSLFESKPRVQNLDESLTFTSTHPFQIPELGLNSGPGMDTTGCEHPWHHPVGSKALRAEPCPPWEEST